MQHSIVLAVLTSFFTVRIDGVDSRSIVDKENQLVRLGYSATVVVTPIGVTVGTMVATVLVACLRRVETSGATSQC
jgi:hypothetical protein